MNLKHKIISVIISSLFFALFFPLVGLGIQFVWFKIAPATYWFEYESVTPNKHYINEDLTFISTTRVKRTVNFSWNDVLFCCVNNSCNTFFSNYDTKRFNVQKHGSAETGWVYLGAIPSDEGPCYLESNIVIHLPFGIKKYQTIYSDRFYLNEDATYEVPIH